MATIPDLKDQYESLDRTVLLREEEAIDAACLLTFQFEYPEQETPVQLDTDEFTAVCPWTGRPDYGTLDITYVPGQSVIELKSLKYYLMSYRDVGIVQEHAAARILKDLVALCSPRWMCSPSVQRAVQRAVQSSCAASGAARAGAAAVLRCCWCLAAQRAAQLAGQLAAQ